MGLGDVLALAGAGLAVGLCGIGAAFAMSFAQRAAAGLMAEKPEMYNKTFILQMIPAAAALFGFVTGFLVLLNVGMGGTPGYELAEGALVFVACLPIALVGLLGTIAQGKVIASCIAMMGKRPELLGKAITLSIMIELFLLLALIVSMLAIMAIPTIA